MGIGGRIQGARSPPARIAETRAQPCPLQSLRVSLSWYYMEDKDFLDVPCAYSLVPQPSPLSLATVLSHLTPPPLVVQSSHS